MPSVDKARISAGGGSSSSVPTNMYPLSPPTSGPPPHGDPGVDSMDRGGQPPHHMPYTYGPYGGPPPPHYPMPRGEKSTPPHPYGQYPPHNVPSHYPGYGGGYMPPYGGYPSGGGGGGAATGPGRGPPWMGYDYPGYPPPSSQHPPPVSRANAPTTAPSSPPKDPLYRSGRSARGGLQNNAGAAAAAAPYSHESSQRPSAPVTPHKRSPEAMGSNVGHDLEVANAQSQAVHDAPTQSSPQHLSGEELDRAKMQAAAELSLAEVRPIQTDFHFFVQDQKPLLMEAAAREVDQSLIGKSAELVQRHRLFLINSNLNCRLLKAWEDLPRDQREEYFKKEEDDRHRFMEDDEVAGRHCFTLTARIRSPSKGKLLALDDDNDGPEGDAAGGLPVSTSPSKMTKGDDADLDGDKASKRFPDNLPTKEESPSKKNKGEEEWV